MKERLCCFFLCGRRLLVNERQVNTTSEKHKKNIQDAQNTPHKTGVVSLLGRDGESSCCLLLLLNWHTAVLMDRSSWGRVIERGAVRRRKTCRQYQVSDIGARSHTARAHRPPPAGEGGPLEAPPEAENFEHFRFISHQNRVNLCPLR